MTCLLIIEYFYELFLIISRRLLDDTVIPLFHYCITTTCDITPTIYLCVKEERQAPLARTSSVSSCVSSGHTPPQGYQTPLDEDDDEPPPLTPRAASLLQAPTPNSAVMTVSLEGYLEPTRISFGSPPSSELNPRGPSPDETFPVFSPPPYNRGTSVDRSLTSNMRHRRQSSLPVGSTWMNSDPRQSIISTASRSPHSHHTCKLFIDYSIRVASVLQ